MSAQSISENQIETDRAVIEAELQRLLKQKRFSAATQMSAFLKYIVTQTLDGNGDRIKAYTVGVDALGKPESFDAQNDPSVRVLALRLRKCLHASYEQEHGFQRARIVLKVGTYVPEFLKAEDDQRLDVEQSSSMLSGAAESESPITLTTPGEAPPGSKHLQIGGLDQPLGNTVNYDQTADGVGDPAMSDSPEVSVRGTSWLVTGMLLLIVAGWTLSGSRNDSFAQNSAMGLQNIQYASVVPQDSGALHETVPTLYIPSNETQSVHLRQVVTLLGSSIVEQGNIDVLSVSMIGGSERPSGNGYWMMLHEIQIDGLPKLVMQLLRQDSGEVVMSKTLTFGSADVGFSREEVYRIEALANDVSSTNGLLFQDFCTNRSMHATEQCSLNANL